MTALVVRRTLRDQRAATLGWGGVIVLLLLIELAVYPSVSHQTARLQQLLDSYPTALRDIFGIGSDYTSGPGFLHAELFGFVVPVAMVGLAISLGSAATTREEDRHILDVLLSSPLRRQQIVIAKAMTLAVALLLVAASLALVILAVSPAVGLHVGTVPVLGACSEAWLVGNAFGALALAAGSATGRHGIAAGSVAALALLSFLIEGLQGIAPSLHAVRFVSLFHYGGDAIHQGLGAADAAALVAVTAAAWAVATVVFCRRDLH
jgi:ABC-2 type transport system permease protein